MAFRAEPRFTKDVDLDEAAAAAALIEERGFNRGQSLSRDLASIVSQVPKK